MEQFRLQILIRASVWTVEQPKAVLPDLHYLIQQVG